MSKRTFTREELQSILYGDVGKVLVDQVVSTGRWATTHRFVFQPDDSAKLYETEYSKAATELQVERPWEYQDEVECSEVEAFEMKVTGYRLVT
jgi:hypothetical protein